MLFVVNPNDGLPIYRQLIRQVKHALAAGRLNSGDKLPSQRELSKELEINHLTVKKAYELLEAEGLIQTERGRGTFVSAGKPAGLKKAGKADLKNRAREVADAARLLGISEQEFHELAKKAWEESGEAKG